MSNFYTDKKPHISPSAVASWLTNKGQFKRTYFEDKYFENEAMRNGKKIHRDIEHGLVNVKNLYSDSEKPLKVTSDLVDMYGILDGSEKDLSEFVDYKTGKKWTQEQLDNDIKMEFYAYMIFNLTDNKETIGKLEWVETDYDDSGDIVATGETEVFEVKYKREDVVEKWDDLLPKVVSEVNEAYDEYVKSQDQSDELKDLSYRLSEVKKEQEELANKEAWLRAEIEKEMDKAGFKEVKTPYLNIYFQNRKKYNMPDEFKEKEKELKAEKKEIEKTLIEKGEFEETPIRQIRLI